MRKNVLLLVLLFLSCSGGFAQDPNPANGYLQNRVPLQSRPYLELPLGAIRPKGWMLEQLRAMKSGMCGQLDKMYPTVLGPRNGWLGGDGDVWERGPYWLDGLVPLAYILDDKELKAKAQPWIEWSLKNQMADGYFGPIPPAKEPSPEPGLQRDRARDWWPKMVMLKVLQQYYNATNDQRVISLMLKYAKYQQEHLAATPLGHYSWWGAQRGGDNLLVVYWLYNITGEKFLLSLAETIHKQSFDWTNTFLYADMLTTTYKFHGVNLAQGIKEPVIYYQQRPETQYVNAVKKALHDIRTYQGQVQGMYGADELTRGNDPVQGSELCSAVELMYSLENMMSITGDVGLMDHLEKIAFNALPTQATDDQMARQYYQQANQVMVSRHHRNFVTAYDGTDQCFGALTGYPCCTTNMHQGWPKFVQNLWFATEDRGVAALMYSASEVNIKVADGEAVQFTEETDYPFDNRIRFTLKSAKKVLFPFHLRIPAWCPEAIIKINGEVWMRPKGNQVVKVNRTWTNKDVLELELPMKTTISRWFNQSVGVERGPLVYALKMKENWTNVDSTDRFGAYREVHSDSPWNYGLADWAIKNIDSSFTVINRRKPGNNPWNPEEAPIEIRTKGKIIPEWKLYNETAGPIPYSTINYLRDKPFVEITLLPYGCTTLRISQFPVVN